MAEVTDIVERVARAMFTSDGVCSEHDWGNANNAARTYWRNQARAALAAMLEAVGEPVAWKYEDDEVRYAYLDGPQKHLINVGLSETPLYSLAALREEL